MSKQGPLSDVYYEACGLAVGSVMSHDELITLNEAELTELVVTFQQESDPDSDVRAAALERREQLVYQAQIAAEHHGAMVRGFAGG